MEATTMFLYSRAYRDEEGALRASGRGAVPIHYEISRLAAGQRHDQLPGRSLVHRAYRIPHPGHRARPRRRPTVPGRNRRQAEGAAAMMTDQARTGVPPGAEMPVASLLGRRSLRQAAHLILWLLLIGLAAAVVYVMLDVMLASAAGLGPHSPGPPPHPVPVPNPAPVPPGS
jgi:hypothetical protein